MAIAELDGAGGHTFRRVTLAPRNGRIISSNADAFHSADVDTAATLDHCHFRVSLAHMQCLGRPWQHFEDMSNSLGDRLPSCLTETLTMLLDSPGDCMPEQAMLDDFINYQTTLLLAIPNTPTSSPTSTSWMLVHPHVADQPDDIGDDGKPVTDHWYVRSC